MLIALNFQYILFGHCEREIWWPDRWILWRSWQGFGIYLPRWIL